MGHLISNYLIDQLTKGPSDTKTTQVANLQNYIQGVFGSGYHTFLQGSYKNDTAILDINDVDIMVIRLKTYSSQHSPLANPQNPTIFWEQIFKEMEDLLKTEQLYHWVITRGNKCITLSTTNFKADVVPAVQVGSDYTVDPVAIYSFRDGIEKVNYPRTHYENGVTKNRETSGNYKFMVRMFKNWSKNFFDNKDILSSYKIESLVYHIDSNKFTNDYVQSFIVIASEIYKKLKQREVLPYKMLSVCGHEDIVDNWSLSNRQLVANQLLISIDFAVKAYKETDQTTANGLFRKAFNI